jgi:hypothetical protein
MLFFSSDEYKYGEKKGRDIFGLVIYKYRGKEHIEAVRRYDVQAGYELLLFSLSLSLSLYGTEKLLMRKTTRKKEKKKNN